MPDAEPDPEATTPADVVPMPPTLAQRLRESAERERRRAEARFERHQHRSVVDLGLRMYHRDRESAGMLIGSAIAFRLFLFFIPMLLFVVGLAGFIGSAVDGDQLNEATGTTGQLAAQIRFALNQPGSTRWIAVLSGLVGMATTGRSLSKVLTAASSLAWRLPLSSKPTMKVVGSIVGLMAGLALCASIVNRIRTDLGLPAAGASLLIVAGVYFVVLLTLFALLPRPTPDPGSLIPGAVLVAAVLVLMQAVSQLYLPDRFGKASQLYGAIGTTVVTLGWFFFLGRALVIGLAINAVLYERFGSISTVVFSLPVVRAIPRRSARVRRIFGLDDTADGPGTGEGTGEDVGDGSVA